MAWNYSLTFDSKEPSCVCVLSPLPFTQKEIFFFFFASLCPCHDYSLEMFTRNKDWLFTLFLLSLPFWTDSRAGYKFLNWSPPISYQEMQRGAGWLWIFSLEPIYLLPQDHEKTWNIIIKKNQGGPRSQPKDQESWKRGSLLLGRAERHVHCVIKGVAAKHPSPPNISK